MKNLLSALLCSLVAVLAVGCGSSHNNDLIPPGGQTGDVRVLISADRLAELFPAVTTQALEDPSIVEYRVFAYDAAGNLVTQVNQPRVPGTSLDVLLTGLQVLNFDVIVAGVNANGELVGAASAEDVVPVPNSVLEVTGAAFSPLAGFVLPQPDDDDDDDGPVEGEETLDVSVQPEDGIYFVSWGGEGGEGAVRIISAVPVELIDDIQAGNVNPGDPEVAARIYSATSTQGDTLVQPFALTDETQNGVVFNDAFEGFDGSDYRVTVTRENGEFGYLDISLDSPE